MTRVLITSARFPFALDQIRKFGHLGHEVFASDTFGTAPGTHSKYVKEAILTPQPRYQPQAFREALLEAIHLHELQVLVPTFEEVFYITKHIAEFRTQIEVFAPDFETSAMLHDKVRFLELARELGLRAPRMIVVETAADLLAATQEVGSYFARAKFSRGGISLLTNTGPLAEDTKIEECIPTPHNPWIVQDFMHGTDVCSFSVVQQGKVVAHSAYVHPRTLEHSGGVVLESVDEPGTLDAARTIVEATGYHGQISLDFMKLEDGTLHLVECNPRPTNGVVMMPDQMFVDAVLKPDLSRTQVAPAGARFKMSMALVRDMVRNWREIPADVEALLSDAKDVYADAHDVLPALYQLLSYSHVFTYRKQMHTGRHPRTDLMAAYFYDVCWDGQPID